MAFLKLAPTPRFDPNGQFLDSLRKYQMRGAPPAKSYLSMNAMQTPAFSGTVPEDSEDAILASLLDGVFAPAIGGSTGSTSRMPSGGISSLIGADGISVGGDSLAKLLGAMGAGEMVGAEEPMPIPLAVPPSSMPQRGMGDMLSVDPAGLGGGMDMDSLVAEAIASAKAPIGPGAKPENLSYMPELEASDRKRALNEALMNAGAALLSSAGSGKYSEGLSKAMGLGLASYNQSLDKAQKMRDEQELRLRTRTKQEQEDWEFGQKKAERPLVIAKSAQDLEKGAIDLKLDKDKLEQLNRGRKALETISVDDPIWATDSAKTLGLGPKFRAAIEAGAYDQAGLIYSAAASAAGKDIDAKQAHDFAMEIQKYSRGTQLGVANIYGNARIQGSGNDEAAQIRAVSKFVEEIRKEANDQWEKWKNPENPFAPRPPLSTFVEAALKGRGRSMDEWNKANEFLSSGGSALTGVGGTGNGGFEMGGGSMSAYDEINDYLTGIPNEQRRAQILAGIKRMKDSGSSYEDILKKIKGQ